MAKNHYIIPIFVPHDGCPFDCIFCNQKKITGFDREINANDVETQIRQYLDTIGSSGDKTIEVAFFGGSFTGICKEQQRSLLRVAYEWKQRGRIKEIRISTRPDYINHDVLAFLLEYGVSIIELGVQSMNDEVLKAANRGHTALNVIKSVQMIKSYPMQIGLQMMIGLPQDNYERTMDTANQIIELKPDFVRIYPSLVIKDTYLEKMFKDYRYNPLNLKEAIDLSKILWLKFLKNDIPVIRLGLQATEAITYGKEIVAGPFHPAFRQLVEAEVYRSMLSFLFEKYRLYDEKLVEIRGNVRDASVIVGQNQSNRNYIQERFSIGRIKIIPSTILAQGSIEILWNEGKQLQYDIKQYVMDDMDF